MKSFKLSSHVIVCTSIYFVYILQNEACLVQGLGVLYVFRKLYGINLGTGTCNLLDDNVNILA